MKKKLLVIMLVALTLLPLAAAKKPENANYIGGSFGYEADFEKFKLTDTSYTIRNITLHVEGADFFGKNQYFGVGYSIGGVFPVSVKSGDTTFSTDNFAKSFTFGVSALGRYPVSSKVAIIGGIGFDFNFKKYNSGSYFGGNVSTSTTLNTLEMFGDVKAVYSATDELGIFAGVKLGGPLTSKYKYTLNGEKFTGNGEVSYFYVRPYIGAAYMY